MAYINKKRQREADKERARRYRAKQKGVTLVTPKAKTVTPAVTPNNVKSMTNDQCGALLEHWRTGGGTEWQRRMGVLAAQHRTGIGA